MMTFALAPLPGGYYDEQDSLLLQLDTAFLCDGDSHVAAQCCNECGLGCLRAEVLVVPDEQAVTA